MSTPTQDEWEWDWSSFLAGLIPCFVFWLFLFIFLFIKLIHPLQANVAHLEEYTRFLANVIEEQDQLLRKHGIESWKQKRWPKPHGDKSYGGVD
jgi:hypothetical protein